MSGWPALFQRGRQPAAERSVVVPPLAARIVPQGIVGRRHHAPEVEVVEPVAELGDPLANLLGGEVDVADPLVEGDYDASSSP